jgi:hypothetical protein
MFHVRQLKGTREQYKKCIVFMEPKLNIYYVAAKETMQAGLLTRIMAYGGAITVERTWRVKGKDVINKKDVNPNDTENIKIALNDGWVITFHKELQNL